MLNMPNAQSKRNVLAGRSQSPIGFISALSAWADSRNTGSSIIEGCARQVLSLFFFSCRLSKGWFSPTWWVHWLAALLASTTHAIVADHVNFSCVCSRSATRGEDGGSGGDGVSRSCQRGEGDEGGRIPLDLLISTADLVAHISHTAAGRRQAPSESTWSRLA